MASSLPFESLAHALLTILAIMLFQAFLNHRRGSRPSKQTNENFASLLAAISCLSAKFDQKQLKEKKHQLEIRTKLKNMQSDIDTIKSSLRVRPTENELFINLHQKVLREVRELESNIKKATSLSPVLPNAPPTTPPPTAAPPAAPPPPNQGAPESPTSTPDQPQILESDLSAILIISNSEGEEDGDFGPGGDYNASAPWEQVPELVGNTILYLGKTTSSQASVICDSRASSLFSCHSSLL